MRAILRRTSGVLGLAAAMVVLASPAAGARAHAVAPGPSQAHAEAAAVGAATDGGATADGVITLAGPPSQPMFQPGEPVRLALTVTNTSGAACGLATEPDGTVRVVSLRRDGEDLTPLIGSSYYPDGILSAITASVTATDPGSSITVGVPWLRLDDTVLLRSVVPSASGGLSSLWPVSEPGRYELTVAYAVPLVDAEVARCTGAAATTVEFTIGDVAAGGTDWPWWVAAVAAALLLGVVVVSVTLVRRRGRGQRKPGAAVAAIIVLLGVAAGVVTPGRSAQALIVSDPNGGEAYPGLDFNAAVAECLARFRAPGGDPANLLPHLENPRTPRVTIIPVYGESHTDQTPESRHGQGSSVVSWNPISTADYEPGVPRDPCATLYHELAHAYGFSTGTIAPGNCTVLVAREEIRATIIENLYRRSQGLPERTQYRGFPLPRHWDDCAEAAERTRPEPERQSYCENDADCGRTSGDPHLVTFDRHYYDFQAVGEFVLIRAASGPALQVQVRQAPFGRHRTVSVNSAVAMQVVDRTVAMLLVDGVSRVFLDGEAAALPAGETALSGGARILRRASDIGAADGYDVIWPDGSVVTVDHDGYGYRVLARLPDSRAGAVEGLLGNFDGDPTNDLAYASGELVDLPAAFADLYPSYADSWRVTAETSLFPYADGESTETFTDRDYPASPQGVADLDEPARAQAEQVCRFAGITDPWLFAECVLDVGVSGRPEFAVSTAATARTAPPAGAPIAATPIAEGAIAPGDELTFTGRMGDVIVVDAIAPTLADGCSPVQLLNPAGATIGRGCLAEGRGFIDRVVLEADGEHRVVVDERSGDKGRAMVRVYAARDIDATIDPDGTTVAAVIEQPGSIARYTFRGIEGRRVFVHATASTLPAQCSPLRLETSDGTRLANGCLTGSGGHIDATPLPADGEYAIVLDPGGHAIGSLHLQLFVSTDRVEPIMLDASPVVAEIDTPGAVLQYEFAASAGTSVIVAATDNTLPSGCAPLRLVDSVGGVLGASCLSPDGGVIGPLTLPADATYRVVIDPIGAGTGELTLALRSG